MILTIFAIAIALLVVGVILMNCFDMGDVWEMITGIAVIVIVIMLVHLVFLGIEVKQLSVIDDRIAMYQEENARIEQQIADVVEQYQKYETDIFMEVAPESAVSMVALYPELKSDRLVQAQIEVYVENNNMIKDLKDQQIEGDVYRWWLYFGGGGD